MKGGLTYREADRIGYNVIDTKTDIHDLHTARMDMWGIDPTEFIGNHVGCELRSTDMRGSAVREIIASWHCE